MPTIAHFRNQRVLTFLKYFFSLGSFVGKSQACKIRFSSISFTLRQRYVDIILVWVSKGLPSQIVYVFHTICSSVLEQKSSTVYFCEIMKKLSEFLYDTNSTFNQLAGFQNSCLAQPCASNTRHRPQLTSRHLIVKCIGYVLVKSVQA